MERQEFIVSELVALTQKHADTLDYLELLLKLPPHSRGEVIRFLIEKYAAYIGDIEGDSGL